MAAEPRRFPGNPQRRSDSPARKSVRFFKNILPSTLHDRRLKIPKKFSKKFGDELSAIATISVPNGRTWHLGLQKVEDRILFSDNWQKFVEYHSIDTDYFLFFIYHGSSNFHVSIFDTSRMEIEYPCHVQSSYDGDVQPNSDKQSAVDLEEEDTTVEETTDDDYYVSLHKPPLFGKTKRKAFNKSADQCAGRKRRKLCRSRRKNCESEGQSDPIELDGDNMSMGGEVNQNDMHCPHYLSSGDEDAEIFVSKRLSITKFSKETQRAFHAAKRCKRAHPSFMAVLQNANLCNHYVDVPGTFVEKYMLNCSESIQLEGFNGERWNVRCSVRTRSKVKRICRGMDSFFKDNNLKEGDVCVFELIKKKGILLKFLIYHAAEHGDPSSSKNRRF